MLIDTHCHIHESDYADPEGAYTRALQSGVTTMVVVGTDSASSRQAVEFVTHHDAARASVGIHPHEAKHGWRDISSLLEATSASTSPGVIAIGEIGLDYFYSHSPRQAQIEALEAQLQLAQDYKLPVIFHVRGDADGGSTAVWDDFWPIVDNFSLSRGVLHSFTDTVETLETALGKGFYIGVNGISTFARDKQAMFAQIPLANMVLETDAPFLTPVPFRGTVNEPAFVKNVAEFHATNRSIDIEEVAAVTTANACELFAL